MHLLQFGGFVFENHQTEANAHEEHSYDPYTKTKLRKTVDCAGTYRVVGQRKGNVGVVGWI